MFSRNIHIRKLGKISVFYAVITDLTFHVTLQDNVIKNSCDFVEGSSNVYPSICGSMAIGVLVVEIK